VRPVLFKYTAYSDNSVPTFRGGITNVSCVTSQKSAGMYWRIIGPMSRCVNGATGDRAMSLRMTSGK